MVLVMEGRDIFIELEFCLALAIFMELWLRSDRAAALLILELEFHLEDEEEEVVFRCLYFVPD
jgi:hypothetical protein